MTFRSGPRRRRITAEASGNVGGRRPQVGELRDEYGYRILSHKDRRDLEPGQYLLQTDKRLPALPRGIFERDSRLGFETQRLYVSRCAASLLAIPINFIRG